MHSAEVIRKQEFSESLPRASIQDVGTILMGAGYEVIMLCHDSHLTILL
jgi:cytochrome c biogenesis protein